MEFGENVRLSGFPEYLKNLLVDIQTSGDFADVTLVCDDQQQLRAHRNILSAHCKYEGVYTVLFLSSNLSKS